MPSYQFEASGDEYRAETNLRDDAAAWAELIIWCGETLKDAEGTLGPEANFTLRVWERDRLVGEVSVRAVGPAVVRR